MFVQRSLFKVIRIESETNSLQLSLTPGQTDRQTDRRRNRQTNVTLSVCKEHWIFIGSSANSYILSVALLTQGNKVG